MKRNKHSENNTVDDTGLKLIWWRKTGGGSFRGLKGRIIKPNEKFQAYEHEIPKSFRDVIIPLQTIPSTTKSPAPEVKGVDPVYTVKARGKGGWYDVVDANGKVLNEKALKKEVAEKLVQDLAK